MSDSDSGSDSDRVRCPPGDPLASISGGASGVSSLPRYNVNLDNIHIKVEPTKAVSQACVLVGIAIKLDPSVMLSLKQGTLYPFNSSEVDNTIVAFCAYQNVYKELAGNSQVASANKVSSVNVGYDNGEFLISAVCDRTLSSVRKTAGLIVKNLKFSTTYSPYKAYCSTLNIKPDTAGFAYAVNLLNKSVNSNINISVTGKVSIKDKTKVEDMAVPISNKLKDLQNKDGSKQRVASNESGCHDNFVKVILPTGLDRAIAKDYLDSFLMKTVAVDGIIILPAKFETMLEKLNDQEKFKRFADKLDRLGDNLAGVLSYTASIDCSLSTNSISSGKELDLNKIKAALKGIF